MKGAPVLIAGAGPTGLVLALWLTRLGIRVRIVDLAADAGTTTRALAVQARTLEFYRQLGIADAVVAGGVKIESLNFRVRGRAVARIPLRRIGDELSPYPFALVFPQDAHERLLIERLGELGVRVERETELVSFRELDGGVRSTLRHSDGAEEEFESIYLAGCDGASSRVRQALGIGYPGGTYTGLFYIADVLARGPGTDDELHVDLEDADFLLVFPLKGDGRIRLVGVVRDLPDRDRGKLTFEDVKGKAIERFGFTVEHVNWFSTYRVHHRVASRFASRRVFLLGDAAHIHSPVGGQGMNTGIGDAVNLAWKLAAVLSDGAPERLLATYEQERIPFARSLVATTDRAFTVVTARGPVARIVRTRIAPRLIPVLFRIPPLRRFLFRTLSQIGIHYRSSTVSVGDVGDVRGGDRLPWVAMGAGKDNFMALESLDWQVHVYGAAGDKLRAACERLQLPLHEFAWQAGMQRAGLRKGALYLIRPDGYIALADAGGDPGVLRQYFVDHIRPRDSG